MISMPPKTLYARSGNVHIAYQVIGAADPARPDLVLSYGYGSNVEAQWEQPRFAAFLDQLAELGRLVIYDRYVYEARLPAKPPLVAAKRLYHWGLRHAIPRPDTAVVLDVPGEVAYTRKQENPPEELESERRVYAGIAATEPGVVLVDASQPADAVRADVTEVVWRKLADRWRR